MKDGELHMELVKRWAAVTGGGERTTGCRKEMDQ